MYEARQEQVVGDYCGNVNRVRKWQMTTRMGLSFSNSHAIFLVDTTSILQTFGKLTIGFPKGFYKLNYFKMNR